MYYYYYLFTSNFGSSENYIADLVIPRHSLGIPLKWGKIE